MPEVHTVHCGLCGKAISGTSFGERMTKLRSHRKKEHPTAHKKSVRKSVSTKKGSKMPRKTAKRLRAPKRKVSKKRRAR